MSDSLGERAATEDEIEDWVTRVKAGRAATRAFKARSEGERRRDRNRPKHGSGVASHEDGE